LKLLKTTDSLLRTPSLETFRLGIDTVTGASVSKIRTLVVI
jgi:hypothetical protein